MRLATRALGAVALLTAALPASALDLSISGSSVYRTYQGLEAPYEAYGYVVGVPELDNVTYHLYLSTDPIWSEDDIFLVGDDFPEIQEGEAEEEDVIYTVPDVADGYYYVLAVIDPNDFYDEGDETNNVAAWELYIGEAPEGAAPDFSVGSAGGFDPVIEAGDTISPDFGFGNVGNFYGRAAAGVYLSDDATWSPAADSLVFQHVRYGFPAGGGTTLTSIFEVPFETAPGDYYLLFVADNLEELDEPDEANNVFAVAVEIVGGQPVVTGEAGVRTFDARDAAVGYNVDFFGTYVQPVVVATSFASSEGDPAALSVRERHPDFGTSYDYELEFNEWGDLDDDQDDVVMPYLVLEAGQHVLAGGRRVEAGVARTKRNGIAVVEFATPFEGRPIVLATKVSPTSAFPPLDAEPIGVQTRVRRDKARFDLVREEAAPDEPFDFTDVAWVAIEPGLGPEDGPLYTALFARQGDRAVGSAPEPVGFGRAVPDGYVFLGAPQTVNERDPVTTRVTRWLPRQVTVELQEETTADAETVHTSERFGFAVFAPGPFQAASSAPPAARVLGAEAWDDGLGDEGLEAPVALGLDVAPNPTTGRATVVLDVPAAGPARVDVLDALGRRVATLLDGPVEAGRLEASLDLSALPAGVYLVRVVSPSGLEAAPVTVAR